MPPLLLKSLQFLHPLCEVESFQPFVGVRQDRLGGPVPCSGAVAPEVSLQCVQRLTGEVQQPAYGLVEDLLAGSAVGSPELGQVQPAPQCPLPHLGLLCGGGDGWRGQQR
ncbi:MAG TPA: hypothetical protein VEL76_29320 [Gemmataceae bacterium]|nr:hypothetical protein [Gemmataceae bacterium]